MATANKFTIVIDATDRASAVVNKFNKRVDAIFKPVTRAQQVFTKLGKTIGQNTIVKGMTNIAKSAASVVSSISNVGLAIAGLSVGAGVAAIASMTRDWVAAGSALSRTSAITGISVEKIQSLSGAAQVFGLEAGDMTAGLKTLGDTMEDALYGRNQEALMIMNRLGISVKHTKDGVIDTAAGFMDIAKAISHIKNVQAQGLAARTFGMENLLPLLQQGPDGIRRLQEIVRRTNAIMSTADDKKVKDYSIQLAELELSFKGLGNSIAIDLLPNLSQGTTELTKFIEKTSAAIKAGKLFDFSSFGGVGDTWNWLAKTLPPVGVIDKIAKVVGRGTLADDPFADYYADKKKPSGRSGNGKISIPGGDSEARMQGLLSTIIPGFQFKSGRRSAAHNAAVGGAAHSYHLLGEAMDFNAPGQSKASIRAALQRAGLPIAELLSAEDERLLGNAHPSDFHYAWGHQKSPLDRIAKQTGSNAQAPGAAPGAGTATHVMVEFMNPPPGTRAKVKKQGDTPAVVKVNYSLPTVAGP